MSSAPSERRTAVSNVGAYVGTVQAGARACPIQSARVVKKVLRAVRPRASLDVKSDAWRCLGDLGPSGHDRRSVRAGQRQGA